MTFTVKQNSGRFYVIGYDKVVDSFDDEQSAKHTAEKMNAEYERVLSFL